MSKFLQEVDIEVFKNAQTKSVLKFQPTAIYSSWEIINKNLFNVYVVLESTKSFSDSYLIV